MFSSWSYVLKVPIRGVLPPSTPALAGEAQILPDKSNHYLVKKLMGTSKSQLFIQDLSR